MKWHIVPQTEGKEEIEVLAKHVQWFASIDKKTKAHKFGRMGRLVLRVIVSNGSVEHKITWSTPDILKNAGGFVYHWPDKLVPQMIKLGNGRSVEDRLSPKVVQKVSKPCTMTWLRERFGEFAEEIEYAFSERIAEFKEKAAAKAA